MRLKKHPTRAIGAGVGEQRVHEPLAIPAPTGFGYSLTSSACTHTLHMSYVRAMQEPIAASAPAERVGLYCAQLLDLGR